MGKSIKTFDAFKEFCEESVEIVLVKYKNYWENYIKALSRGCECNTKIFKAAKRCSRCKSLEYNKLELEKLLTMWNNVKIDVG